MSASATAASAFTIESVKAFSAKRREPEFLLERRLKALALWNEMPLPGKQDEFWRRVKLPTLDFEALAKRASSEKALKLSALEAAGSKAGVFFGTLDAAIAQRADLLKKYWATKVYPAGDAGGIARRGGKFHALNQTLFDTGYVLHVPKNASLKEPLEARFTSQSGTDGLYPHNLIVLEDGAEATLIEIHESAPGAVGLSVPQAEVILGAGAKLHYLLLQNVGSEIIHIGAHRVVLGAKAFANFPSAHLGSTISKSFLELEMEGEGSKGVLYGLYYGLGQQKLHMDTWQHHIAPGCTTDLMFKGVLDDRAMAVYRGMIHLEPAAQKTDAYQQNRTLLLSDDATIHSIPGLEILANDVKCTHGSTAGQIDQNMLFYLLSRGVRIFDARKMVMDGFFEEVIVKFDLPQVVEPLRNLIDVKIAAKR